MRGACRVYERGGEKQNRVGQSRGALRKQMLGVHQAARKEKKGKRGFATPGKFMYKYKKVVVMPLLEWRSIYGPH